MTSFKIYFDDNNIRRISTELEYPTYEQFQELLQSLYPTNYHPELFIRWRDEDGDSIIVSSQPEWEEMFSSIKERPIKLYVTEGQGPYFKDGPPAEAQFFYEQEKEKVKEVKEENEFLARLKKKVPECLERLYSCRRILPDNIPSWLKEAVKIKKRLPGNEVDLDVDIPKLFHAMHKRALECLKDAKNIPLIQQAKALLQDMLEIVPKHAVTLYNLSCAEALLGNTKEAVKRLRDAIFDGGYRNFDHIDQDEDLENIRSTEEYQELLKEVKSNEQVELPTATPPAEPEKPVEPVPEPEKPVERGPDPEQKQVSLIEEDWTSVEKQNEETATQEPVLSAGEQKWAVAIDLLRNMGFDQGPYFGPRCVVLLEKYNGDLPSVINDFLME